MIKLAQTGVGTADAATAVRDSNGTGQLPLQIDVAGTVTYRVMGRVSPEGRWNELVAAIATDTFKSIPWVPYIRLEVTAGSGTATLWLGEK
jgi:hypothetical protein